MPIKLPKGFARRKSSGTVLEEVENPPETSSSFKVYERSGGGSRSFDGPAALKRMSQGRPLSSPGNLAEDDHLFSGSRSQPKNRGSGGTTHSNSTGGLYDSSASSARFSSSSTLPSSTDVPTGADSSVSLKRALQEIPVPPIPENKPAFSIRTAGRTFSFGNRASKSFSPLTTSKPEVSHESPTVRNITRERGMTTSSASTATPPPKLGMFDGDLNFESDGEGFSNMFEGFGQRGKTPPLPSFALANSSSPVAMNESDNRYQPTKVVQDFRSTPPPPVPPKSVIKDRTSFLPSPIIIDRSQQIESSPYSWGSHDSRENLMSSPSSRHGDIPGLPRKPVPASESMPLPRTISPVAQIKGGSVGLGLRRSSAYGGRRGSTPIEDEDARLVQDSALASQRPYESNTIAGGRRKTAQPESIEARDSVFGNSEFTGNDTSGNWRIESSELTPKPKKAIPERSESPIFDPALVANAHLASQYETREPSPTRPRNMNKVMTPAQFENYRRQQELYRTKSNASESEPSENGSEDEDETERNRQAAKQRKKQEAHLSVYRQQMMKVTGEQANDPSSLGHQRNSGDKISLSAPNLPQRFSTLGFGGETIAGTGKASDDEDEEVPLGILAAHGFPNKNRPPTRMSASGSTANLRLPSQSVASPGSVMGETTATGPRGSLPPFARHLPQDPYYGASLVIQSNREAPGTNGAMGSTVMTPPGVPPGGLVGVIAGEERARAARRGSPNAQGGYEVPPIHPGMQRSQTMGNIGMMGPMVPGMPPMLSPGDQAQIHMSQQMTQMMQMQMQWMQQMMQMQGVQPGQMPPPPMMNNFLGLPGAMQRPVSMGGSSAPVTPGLNPAQSSMLDPNVSQWGRNSTFAPSIHMAPSAGYTPSIAPSERSNVGMASRYRPVSTAPPPIHDSSRRTSTFTSSSFQPWDDHSQQPALPPQSGSTIKQVNAKAGKVVDDDDDEEGWAEMKKKRDKKRSNWKMRKGANNLHEVFHGGL